MSDLSLRDELYFAPDDDVFDSYDEDEEEGDFDDDDDEEEFEDDDEW